LWAHRSYEAHWTFRLILMLVNSIANQGSIYHWARDHRTHHLHSDTDMDPHNSRRGFFFSHCGWLLTKKDPRVVEAGRKVDISDLKADPIVMFQKRLDPWWNLFFCFIMPALFSMFVFEENFFNGIMVSGFLRYVVVLHCTWCVNSIAHLGDDHHCPYAPKNCPKESPLVAFLSFGEGWHSWHHAFPFDYACAELGFLQQYNPTKLLIDLFALCGLVWNRKRGHHMWNARKAHWTIMKNKEGDSEGVFVDTFKIKELLNGPKLFKMRKIQWFNSTESTN